MHYWVDFQSVHGFRCYDYSDEREMSASACTHSVLRAIALACFTDQFSGPGRALGPVCVSLCITFELYDL